MASFLGGGSCLFLIVGFIALQGDANAVEGKVCICMCVCARVDAKQTYEGTLSHTHSQVRLPIHVRIHEFTGSAPRFHLARPRLVARLPDIVYNSSASLLCVIANAPLHTNHISRHIICMCICMIARSSDREESEESVEREEREERERERERERDRKRERERDREIER